MNKIKIICVTFLIILSADKTFGQEHNDHEEEEHNSHSSHENHKRHSITASINHTMIFGAVQDGSASSLTLPSFGLNYTYAFNHKWGIGLHNDIILEDFVVKEKSTSHTRSSSDDGDITVIERGNPVAACIMGIYKPLPWLGLMAGFGREFSSHEDFNVIRFGIEAPYHLPKNWELFGVLTYDINIDAYESLTYGIGIGKLF